MTKTTASALAILITVLGTVARAQEGAPAVPDAAVDELEAPPPQQPPAAAREQTCDDRQDDDGDGMADCADSDCWEAAHCQAGQSDERDNLHCGDWIDNDGDGSVDCEDDDCTNGPGVTVCNGSAHGAPQSSGAAQNAPSDAIPALEGDMSVEDLIGRGGDVDGERTDEVCSDGADNDGDGRTDCADFGCRFDPSVQVCSSAPGIRFGVVVGIAGSLRLQETPDIDGDGFSEFTDPLGDVRFQRLQLRAIGPIPFIQNSFFLLNIRAERTFRLTFAMFQIPLSNQGHFLSINSGSGGLSPGLIVSTSKQPLLDPPRYLFDGFEAPAGAAIEVGGPIIPDSDLLRFRVFASGGSGEFNGNVGGRFFRAEDRNFSYGAGGQLQLNIVGHYNRLDTPFLYTEVPLTIAALAGARFDQRPDEQYVAWNAFAILRYWRFLIRAEHYGRYVLDVDGVNTAWNVQVSFLVWPRTIMFAADVGSANWPLRPLVGGTEAPVMETFQFRAAFHWFYFRQIGILSLLYSMTMNCQDVFSGQCLPPDGQPDAPLSEHEIRLEAQFRF